MSGPRSYALLAAPFTLAFALAPACSFPDPTLVPDDAAAAADSPGIGQEAGTNDAPTSGDGGSLSDGADSAPDATVDGVAPTDALIDGDDANPADAPADSELDAPVDTGFDSGNSCDKDGDGYLAKGGVCGGNDCDDNDKLVNPGVTQFQYTTVTPPETGDWNCANGVTKLYPVNVACSGLALGACASVAGFTDNPACGAVSTYVTCKVSTGVLCVQNTSEQRQQGCL